MLYKKTTIVKSMQIAERSWNTFLKSNFSENIELLKWGQGHRVYKFQDKIIKIDKKIDRIDYKKNLSSLGLKYEYKVLNLLRNTAYDLKPKFSQINNTWQFLEIDFFEGELLELNSWKKKISIMVYIKIICGLFVLSLKGIKYKQFRGRHIIKNKNEVIKFIDFGESEISSPITSFFYNFKFFNIQNKKFQIKSILSIFYFNFFQSFKDFDFLDKAKLIFLKNKKRLPFQLPDFLKENPGDFIASKKLKLMELNLEEAIKFDQNIYLDILDIKFDNYELYGFKNWPFIWHHVSKVTSFKNKIVFEIFCCQAAFSSFSILKGARKAIASDPCSSLIEASRNFSSALGIDHVYFVKAEKLEDLEKISYKHNPDILFACSYRLDCISVDQLIKLFVNFNEVFWDTNEENINVKKLKLMGFNVIKNLVKSGSRRTLFYLSKN